MRVKRLFINAKILIILSILIFNFFDIKTSISQVTYKIHGLNFGPYTRERQDPNYGTVISEQQIRNLLRTIAPYTEWIRTYGCSNGLENVGRIAHRFGLKVAAGAWLSRDLQANEREISKLIEIGQRGEADMLIVGSEVLLRNDLTEAQLINYINRVKQAVPGIPVATADAYNVLLQHPNVVNAGTVVLPNYYPYWEGIDVRYAVSTIHIRHQQLRQIAGNKPIIISETGWPSAGNRIGEAIPSPENAAFYFLNFVSWAKAENIQYFYFEAFDEPWKANYEGPQGAHWGVWDKNGNLKPGMEQVFRGETMSDNWSVYDILGGSGNPRIEFTYVPPYGSFEDLRGQVWHVRPSEYKVAVYIRVNGGWWTKPYWNNPLTNINSDGSWVCDITTGGIDHLATEIIAYLVPIGYYPPSMSGQSSLPWELEEFSLAHVRVDRNILYKVK